MKRRDGGEAANDDALVPVGAPLDPTEAAYLEDELSKRGMEAFTNIVESAASRPEAVVRVHARDRDAAAALREEFLPTPKDEPAVEAPARGPRGRRRATTAAATAAVAVFYLGRALPRAFGAVAAVVAGVLVYLSVSALTRAAADPARDDD